MCTSVIVDLVDLSKRYLKTSDVNGAVVAAIKANVVHGRLVSLVCCQGEQPSPVAFFITGAPGMGRAGAVGHHGDGGDRGLCVARSR